MKDYINYLKNDLFKAIQNDMPESVIQSKYKNLSKIDEYFNKTEAYIKDAAMDYWIDTEALKQRIWMLEAVLLIHGVNDFPLYIAKGFDYLINQVHEFNAKGIVSFPAKISDAIPPESKNQIIKYLNDAAKS